MLTEYITQTWVFFILPFFIVSLSRKFTIRSVQCRRISLVCYHFLLTLCSLSSKQTETKPKKKWEEEVEEERTYLVWSNATVIVVAAPAVSYFVIGFCIWFMVFNRNFSYKIPAGFATKYIRWCLCPLPCTMGMINTASTSNYSTFRSNKSKPMRTFAAQYIIAITVQHGHQTTASSGRAFQILFK